MPTHANTTHRLDTVRAPRACWAGRGALSGTPASDCWDPLPCAPVAPSSQRRYSVAKIDNPVGYDKGRPKMGGLSDPRLGTMDRSMKCTTDGAGVQDCPGYFGHIELAKPVYHVGFIKTVIKVLRCVSYHTSKILVDKVRGRGGLSGGWERRCVWGRCMR